MSQVVDTMLEMFSSIRLHVEPIASKLAAKLVVDHHYLHRRPPISHAFGLFMFGQLVGVVTFGTPASRHLQMGACPSAPGDVIELNRLWVHDSQPKNTESWFVSRAMKMLPPKIVVSYADPVHGHYGYIYRALNFRYAGWTDMDRKTPRYDYVARDPSKHTRESSRSGVAYRVRRIAKVKYWSVTGTRAERRSLIASCAWPALDWNILPPPHPQSEEISAVA